MAIGAVVRIRPNPAAAAIDRSAPVNRKEIIGQRIRPCHVESGLAVEWLQRHHTSARTRRAFRASDDGWQPCALDRASRSDPPSSRETDTGPRSASPARNFGRSLRSHFSNVRNFHCPAPDPARALKFNFLEFVRCEPHENVHCRPGRCALWQRVRAPTHELVADMFVGLRGVRIDRRSQS